MRRLATGRRAYPNKDVWRLPPEAAAAPDVALPPVHVAAPLTDEDEESDIDIDAILEEAFLQETNRELRDCDDDKIAGDDEDPNDSDWVP